MFVNEIPKPRIFCHSVAISVAAHDWSRCLLSYIYNQDVRQNSFLLEESHQRRLFAGCRLCGRFFLGHLLLKKKICALAASQTSHNTASKQASDLLVRSQLRHQTTFVDTVNNFPETTFVQVNIRPSPILDANQSNSNIAEQRMTTALTWMCWQFVSVQWLIRLKRPQSLVSEQLQDSQNWTPSLTQRISRKCEKPERNPFVADFPLGFALKKTGCYNTFQEYSLK